MTLLRCDWCEYKVLAWSKDQAGRAINGHLALRCHVLEHHAAQFLALRQRELGARAEREARRERSA